MLSVAILSAGLVIHRAGAALVVTAPLDDPDAIVMLASHEWERLPAAAAVAERHPGADVLLTVPRSPSYWNCFRCRERAEWLGREGVERRRIAELPNTVNTYSEAQAVAGYLKARGLKRVVVVTSPYHARRALATFRSVLSDSDIQVGLEIASANSNATPSRWWRYDADRAYVAYEWTAIAWYGARYGVRPF